MEHDIINNPHIIWWFRWVNPHSCGLPERNGALGSGTVLGPGKTIFPAAYPGPKSQAPVTLRRRRFWHELLEHHTLYPSLKRLTPT